MQSIGGGSEKTQNFSALNTFAHASLPAHQTLQANPTHQQRTIDSPSQATYHQVQMFNSSLPASNQYSHQPSSAQFAQA